MDYSIIVRTNAFPVCLFALHSILRNLHDIKPLVPVVIPHNTEPTHSL